MRALLETTRDGSMAIALDSEAARATIASIEFAAQFHDGIAPLARMVETGFDRDKEGATRRTVCQ